MIKSIHFLVLFSILLTSFELKGQDTSAVQPVKANGYYQTIDLNPDTPCSCDEKTDRTRDLNKTLQPAEVTDYQLHTYSFTFGNSVTAASKLFKALEKDASVYKVSMKEWSSFMLLTTKDFDAASFEAAARQSFQSFAPMIPEDFLKIKNTAAYNAYMEYLNVVRNVTQPDVIQQNGTH